MRRYTLAIALLFSSAVGAQTISPPINEVVANKNGKGQGELNVQNNGLTPIVVTLESHLLLLDEKGKMSMTPVPQNMDLKLSESSFRLPAKSNNTVGWSIQCPRGCAFMVFASAAVSNKNTTGVGVRVLLGSTIYVYHDPKKLNPSDFSASLSADGKTAILRNSGTDIYRPILFVKAGGHEREMGGYPLLPASTREVVLPIACDSAVLRFPKFNIDAVRVK